MSKQQLPEGLKRVVFTLHRRGTDEQMGAYCRAYHEEFEWADQCDARHSNVHGVYENPAVYQVKKWRVIYELIEQDVPC